MTHFRSSNVAGLGALLLALGTPSLTGQTTQKVKPAPAAPSAPAPEDTREQDNCVVDLDSIELPSVEQINRYSRMVEQELQPKLAELEERLQEVEMSSPHLQKLQDLSAQLAGKRDEIESRAEELAARAEELGARAQERVAELSESGPRALVIESDDEGGWLGIEIQEVTSEKAKDLRLANVRGVLVTDVEPDSPAAKAGLKENDVITAYDGQAVEGTVQFRRLVRETPPGRTVALAVSRNGAAQNFSVELGNRGSFFEKKMEGKMRDFGNAYAFKMPNFDLHFAGPDFGVMDWRTPVLGINAEDLSGQLGAYFGAPGNSGILVREVRPGTPAEKAGLQAGDVIIKVDGKAVKSLSELREQLRGKSEQKTVSVGILRKGSEMSLPVEIDKPKPIEPMHLTHRAQL
jgi:serine protease Do